MEELADQLEIGILVLDKSGKVTLANRFLKERGIISDNCGGKVHYEVIRSLQLIGLIDEMLERGESEGEFSFNERVYRVKGRGGIVQVEDVTDLKLQERLQREFVATVSHELSTPVTAIKGFLETILVSGEFKENLVRRALMRAVELEKLIKSVKYLVLLEFEKGNLREEVLLDDVLNDVLEDLKEDMNIRRINVSVDTEPGLRVKCDREKLYILFRNVVENAVRYNRVEGRVLIRAVGSGEYVEVRVEDTGSGIPKGDLPLVFKPFFSAGEHRGMGLGLAISKRIAEFCGGDIGIESEEGVGTTVKIRLIRS